MSRHLAPTLTLSTAIVFATLAPFRAQAQVDIDQDKTPAHIFASDCAVCHKTTRGLANGRGSSALTGFLAEHYTSSRAEAAAVAAYVLAAGGGVGTATPVRDQKPDSTRNRPASGGPEQKPREARRSGKPDEEPGAADKPRRTAHERGKPRDDRSASAEPGGGAVPDRKPPPERRGSPAATRAAHPQPKPAEEAAPPNPTPAPAAVAAAKPAEPPKPTPMSPVPSAPAQPQPAAASPSATDNIPD